MMACLDTNVLAYAEGVNDEERRARALDLIAALPVGSALVPIQVLGELFRLLTAKAGRSPATARAAILSWQDALPVRDSTRNALLSAMDIVVEHRLSLWDALILSVAADAGCRLLLTEDLQENFTWRGVTVVNPFAPATHPLLARLLAGGGAP
jgi:predicted nucleic acid-binding protein